MAYTFPDQIERAYNDGSRYIFDNLTVTYDPWLSTGLGVISYRIFINSGNGAEMHERAGYNTPPPTDYTEINIGNTPYPNNETPITQYTVTPTYTDSNDYVVADDPIPGLDLTAFTSLVSGYYLVSLGNTAKAITQTQPTDSIIIYSTEGGSVAVDEFISQAGNDLVLSVSGANPVVNGDSVFSVNYTNNITYVGSGTWEICGVSVDSMNPLPTSNDGLFTVDGDNNLIYEWQVSGVVTPGFTNPTLPILKIPTARRRDKQPLTFINKLRRFLTHRNKIIL